MTSLATPIRIIISSAQMDPLYDSVSDDPMEDNLIDAKIIRALPKRDCDPTEISYPGCIILRSGIEIFPESPQSRFEFKTDKFYGISDSVRIVSMYGIYVYKHTLGEKNLCYTGDTEDPFPKKNKRGTVYAISDLELYGRNILHLAHRSHPHQCLGKSVKKYGYGEEVCSSKYLEILKDRGIAPKRGDMVHIEVYDSSYHYHRYFYVIIFDGTSFLYSHFIGPSTTPPVKFKFPEFPIHWFSPLNMGSPKVYARIWFSKEVARLYNASRIIRYDANDENDNPRCVKFVEWALEDKDKTYGLHLHQKQGILIAGPKELDEKSFLSEYIENEWEGSLDEILEDELEEALDDTENESLLVFHVTED